MQAANMRAAANHEIQSPGAQITKGVQRKLWDLQPSGIHELQLAVMNIHDELLTVTKPELGNTIVEVVREAVEGYRQGAADRHYLAQGNGVLGREEGHR